MAIRLIDRYPNRANAASSDYPHGSGRNKSSPTAIDGTPFDEARYNDHEALFQSLLEAAEVTPNNAPDTVPASQYADALNIVANGLITIDVAGNANATLDYNQSRVHGFRLTGALTGDIIVVVPDAERMYTVVNDTTGSFGVTVRTEFGSGVVVSQGQTFVVRCDGVDVVRGVDSQRTIYVGSVAELEALSLQVGTNVYLTQDGRSGEFVVKAGTPPSDPQKGIYIVLANGNYAVRVIENYVTPEMYGAIGDGITNDLAAINAALAGAKVPVMMTNSYYVDGGSIEPPSGAYLFSSGEAEFIAGPNTPLMVSVLNKTRVVIEGITLNGNGNFCYLLEFDNSTHSTAKRCVFKNSSERGVGSVNCEYIKVLDCEFTNLQFSEISPADGNCRFTASSYCTMDGVYAHDTYGKVFSMGAADRCVLTNFIAKDTHPVPTGFNSPAFYSNGSTNCIFSNGYVENTSYMFKLSRDTTSCIIKNIIVEGDFSQFGVYIAAFQGSSDNIMENCIINSSGASGNVLEFFPHPTTETNSNNNIIRNNTFTSLTTAILLGVHNPVYSNGIGYTYITGNHVKASNGACISLPIGAKKVVVSNNDLTAGYRGIAAEGSGAGDGDQSDIFISNNRIISEDYAIRFFVSLNNIFIEYNHIDSNDTNYAMSLTFRGKSFVKDNQVFGLNMSFNFSDDAGSETLINGNSFHAPNGVNSLVNGSLTLFNNFFEAATSIDSGTASVTDQNNINLTVT